MNMSLLVEVKNRVCPEGRVILWISKRSKKRKTYYFHEDGTPCKKMEE